jgi:hypothetical protein
MLNLRLEIRLPYLVIYEEDTSVYIARSLKEPLATGEGNSLYGAIDKLEVKLQELQLRTSSKVVLETLIEPVS